MNERQLLIIGGGPAGVMAAIRAAQRGLPVRLVERRNRLLNKLRISGKGRCNITNDTPPEAFFDGIVRNASFMRSAFAGFDNRALMNYLQQIGIRLKVERGGRVFPQSDDAHSIAQALVRELDHYGVSVEYDARVRSLDIQDRYVRALRLEDGRSLPCGACLIATGGKSYPATGSGGDGYALATQAGHTVTPLMPSLAPMQTKEAWPAQLHGLTLKNVELSGYAGGRRVFLQRGDLLFTHQGVSGPLVLSASAHMTGLGGDLLLSIDLKPALSDQQMDLRLQRELRQNPKRSLRNLLTTLMPRSMAPVVLQLIKYDGDSPAHSVNRAQRQALSSLLKDLPLRVAQIGPIEQAIVTRGGVDVSQVRPRDMQSKLVENLYFAGEVLDLDAYTGGYNLQIAFSTGYAAGHFCEIL